MTLVRFTLRAPAYGPVFARIQDALHDLDGFVARLRDKKIDVQHFEAVRRHLKTVETEPATALRAAGDPYHMNLHAGRIYLRALLLQLLDEEDAWQAAEDAKQAAKAAKKEPA